MDRQGEADDEAGWGDVMYDHSKNTRSNVGPWFNLVFK